MPTRDKYVCDADCLINLHRHFGRSSLSALRSLGRQGGLELPEGIVREIKRGTDKLARFVEKDERTLLVRIGTDPRLALEIARLEKLYGETIVYGQQKYPGFWKSRAGRQAADAQVVAAAKMHRRIAVSNDRAVELACSLEGVICIGWAEFSRRIGLVKPEQLEFSIGNGASGHV